MAASSKLSDGWLSNRCFELTFQVVRFPEALRLDKCQGSLLTLSPRFILRAAAKTPSRPRGGSRGRSSCSLAVSVGLAPLGVWASEGVGGRLFPCGTPEDSCRLPARQQQQQPLTGGSLGGLPWTVRPRLYPGDTFKSVPGLRPEHTGSESKTWRGLSSWCPEAPGWAPGARGSSEGL